MFETFSWKSPKEKEFEVNDGVRHPDFDDTIITSIYDFMDMYANGRDIPTMRRTPQFDDDADRVFKEDIDPPTMDYDILDALDDSMCVNKTTTTTNDDDEINRVNKQSETNNEVSSLFGDDSTSEAR